MKVQKFSSKDDWVGKVNHWLKPKLTEGARGVFLPVGRTPREIYANWSGEKPTWLKDIPFLQMDEISTGRKKGEFWKKLKSELGPFKEQIRRVTPGKPFSGDLAILGLGKNGHIAFHEPGLPPDFRFGEVTLLPETCRSLGVEPETRAWTHGAGVINECSSILLLVMGNEKKPVLDLFLSGDGDPENVPVCALKNHKDLSVFILESS